MTKEEIIMRGKQLGFPRLSKKSHDNQATMITTIVQEAIAKERDAIIDLVAMYGGPVDLEAAIRARGEQQCCNKP